MNSEDLLKRARHCLNLESKAIVATADALDESFVRVVRKMTDTLLDQNKLIFTGVGKNVHICEKLVGTFNSTGVTSCFLDPTQALHGDLGVLHEGDLVFLFSNSGETDELKKLYPSIKRLGATTVAVTAVASSELAKVCDMALIYQVPEEACPLDLAPTSSTTAAMALGDALAMVFLEIRGFSREDFAKLHPAGSLGKTLLLRVNDIMRSGSRLAVASMNVTVKDALFAITQAQCGCIALTDEAGRLAGIFTDGDFRRLMVRGNGDILHSPITQFMTRTPKTILSGTMAVDVLKRFEEWKINSLMVVDLDDRPVGVVDSQDLPKLKIV